MPKFNVAKMLYKKPDMKIFICDNFNNLDIVVEEKLRNEKGRLKFRLTTLIKRHEGKLAIWFPPNENGLDGWASKSIEDAAHIRERYGIPLSDEMLDVYDAMITAQNLVK